MKKLKTVLLLWIGLIFYCNCQAQTDPVQLGVRISNNAPTINTGISVRYFLADDKAVEGLVSFNPLAMGALYEIFKPTRAEGLNYFYGAGAYVGFGGRFSSGVQGIIGLDYSFTEIPLNFSIDWKPELNIIRSVNFEPSAIGISARFAFR